MVPGLERIGKYDIVRQIGCGATSRVYLGRDSFSGRAVAIKVFDFADEPDSEQRGRSMRRKAFIAEAGLVGRLTHPHIVGIYDAVSEERLSYVVMEYVAGGTLDAHTDASNLLPLEQIGRAHV